MQEQSNEMIDLTSNYFTMPENDRYVDFFFTDQKDDPLIQNIINQEIPFEERLFPSFINPINTNGKQGLFSSNEQEKKLQTKKKMKNTYASKIAKLIHEEDEIIHKNQHNIKEEQDNKNQLEVQHMNRFGDEDKQSQIDSSSDKKQQKLMKNRLSAQKSRKIKKQYMQILQERVAQLQEQLQTERKNNQKNMEKLKKYSYHQAILNGYFVSRDQMMEKLQEAIKNKSSLEELGILLDSLKFRFSGSGRQRMNIVRYYYEQIFDLLVPDLTKYVLYSANKNIGIFNVLGKQSTQMMKVAGLKSQKHNNIRSFKDSLLESRQNVSSIARELIAAKQKLDRQIKKIDDTTDNIRHVMNVQSEIKCVLFLEKNKYKPEYSAAWKDWKNIFLEWYDKDSSQPKKMVKISEE